MKPFVVFIPGIFGSSLLKCGEIVWPVTNLDKLKITVNNVIEKPVKSLFPPDKHEGPISETIRNLISKLSDKNLTPGPITSNYDNIVALIKEVAQDNFFIFTYDWRNSLNDTVEEFARAFDKLEIGTKNIFIIGHSAGGLIAHKYISSSEKYNTEYSNFSKIKKFISIGSPLQGSVKALTAVLGLIPQNILSPTEVKEILNTEFFKSIYELCPYNLHNLFYHKDSKNPLTSRQIIEVLRKNGFPDSELRNFLSFKGEMQNLMKNENVNYLLISGSYNKPMCSSFLADIETGNLECVYDYGSGDGTVLKDESDLSPEFTYRKMTVLGKHVFLTEIDEVLQIIREELTTEIVESVVLFADIVSNTNKQIEFNLYLIKDKEKYYVIDLNAEHISFSRKTVTLDITKKINKKSAKKNSAEPSVFYFKTKEDYGFIRFKNLTFTYKNKDDELKTEFLRYAKVELEKQEELFF